MEINNIQPQMTNNTMKVRRNIAIPNLTAMYQSLATDVYCAQPFAQIQRKSACSAVSDNNGELHNHGMAAKKQRTIRLIRSPHDDGVGVFCIQNGDKASHYAFAEIPCDIGGRGFALHRLGLGDVYHVRIGDSDDCSCECLGFLRHGYCKHVLGLLALQEKELV